MCHLLIDLHVHLFDCTYKHGSAFKRVSAQVKDQLLALMTDLVDLPPDGEHLRPALLQQRHQLVAEKQRLEDFLGARPTAAPSSAMAPAQASAFRQPSTPPGVQRDAHTLAQNSGPIPGDQLSEIHLTRCDPLNHSTAMHVCMPARWDVHCTLGTTSSCSLGAGSEFRDVTNSICGSGGSVRPGSSRFPDTACLGGVASSISSSSPALGRGVTPGSSFSGAMSAAASSLSTSRFGCDATFGGGPGPIFSSDPPARDASLRTGAPGVPTEPVDCVRTEGTSDPRWRRTFPWSQVAVRLLLPLQLMHFLQHKVCQVYHVFDGACATPMPS